MVSFLFKKKVDGVVKVYQEKTISTGETIEYEGFFAEKCRKNPDFEEIEIVDVKSTDIISSKRGGKRHGKA